MIPARTCMLVSLALLWACAGTDVHVPVGPAADAGTDAAEARSDTGPMVEADTGIVADAEVPGDMGSGACSLGSDGVLAAEQIEFAVGATVLYVQNRDGTTVDGVDTAGTLDEDGVRRWDFSAERPEDHRLLDELVSPASAWWSSRYPDATYAAALDRSKDQWGVFRVSAVRLELLAVVSGEANRTDLRMSPAVEVLRFPMRPGDRWQQSVTGNGLVDWIAVTNVTEYRFEVDAYGEVRTPAARFEALRLRTELEQRVPLTVFSRSQRSFTFLSPCWGVVARVASTDGETAVEFTRASEYRRLGI